MSGELVGALGLVFRYCWLAALSVGVGCADDQDSGGDLEAGTEAGTEDGTVSFWTDYAECGSISHDFCVEVDELSACSSPQDYAPTCGDTGAAATFTLEEGSYSFSASVYAGDLDRSWEGTFTIEANSCFLVNLECS